MKRMKGVLALAALVGLAAGRAWATNTPANGTVTVTPVANVSLTLPTTTYSFGTVSVGVSTVSTAGLTLTNNGQVGVTVNKQITADPSGWTGGTSAGADAYVLYVATSAAQPAPGSFVSATQLGAVSNSTALTGTSATTPTLSPTGGGASVTLWFKLDMPTTTSSQAQKEISLRFTGAAQ